jgi:hypothetical protein
MRILFDECVPRRLRNQLTGIEIKTVGEMGWSGKENGELLRVMVEAGFSVLVTVDRGLPFQQNLHTTHASVIILEAVSNRFDDLVPLMPALRQALDQVRPGQAVRISK